MQSSVQGNYFFCTKDIILLYKIILIYGHTLLFHRLLFVNTSKKALK